MYEDRAFNLDAVVTGYLNQGVGPTMVTKVVDGVEYDPEKDPNRTTVRLTKGASVNAERIELFANARESETRESDGVFFCAEAVRQVTLGYGREYGTARVINTDYQHVWTFTPVYDDDSKRVERVKVSLSTAGYAQPSDALRLRGGARGRRRAGAATGRRGKRGGRSPRCCTATPSRWNARRDRASVRFRSYECDTRQERGFLTRVFRYVSDIRHRVASFRGLFFSDDGVCSRRRASRASQPPRRALRRRRSPASTRPAAPRAARPGTAY